MPQRTKMVRLQCSQQLSQRRTAPVIEDYGKQAIHPYTKSSLANVQQVGRLTSPSINQTTMNDVPSEDAWHWLVCLLSIVPYGLF